MKTFKIIFNTEEKTNNISIEKADNLSDIQDHWQLLYDYTDVIAYGIEQI